MTDVSEEENEAKPAASQREIDEQREALRQNLNALEDTINPAKVVGRVKEKVQDDPAPWIAAATGLAVLIGGIVTLVIVKRR